MTLDRIVNGLKRTTACFARAERGNVAMMFAFMLPVLLSSIGAAVDYSRAANARSAMQAAVDATALMISKEAATLTAAQITTKAQAYFNALYNHPEIGSVTFSAAYTPNSGSGASVKVDATGTMQTDFMKMAGIQTVPLSVSSTTKWGNMRYRVALALDNTGSMASANKMTELKSAATKLINDFYGMATTDADVYISIVPFAKDVNVGTANKNANWLRWTEFDETSGSCSGWGGGGYTTKTSCQNAGRTWNATSHNSWTGCVMDRDENYDVSGNPVSNASAGEKAPAEQYSDCPVSMLKMTPVKSQKQTLLDKINAMSPDGGTNQFIGMFWGWMTLLTDGAVAAPAKDANYSNLDVLILLTDGLNTLSRLYGNGHDHSDQVDARQALLCANAKTAGVKIFAIQVATDNDDVSTVTKNCASEPENPNYFSYITQASQMTVKFQNIFKELAKLRVAK